MTYKRKIAAKLPDTDQYFVKETTRPNVNWCVMARLTDDDQWRAMHWFANHHAAKTKANWWQTRGFQTAVIHTQNWAG